ncbi:MULTISPECIES: YceI family protein [Streptomyces]|jgi:polyisoprenoid-binding protein YceI|uniref:YceI family protein n=1 Tax=Streptomyces sp. 900129855 TaxID=3155129 RepID=A0ABV2ZYT2_9ACTN
MGLSARIRTKDGWALPHAVITVTDMTGAQMLRAEADDEGEVHDAARFAPGSYVVIVTAVGYTPQVCTTLVTASGRADAGTLVLARQGGTELPPPGPWTIDPAHSAVGAVAQHLGISSVRGRFTDFSGRIEIGQDVEKSRVEAIVNSASIDTGNGMRDGHLRSADFLNVEDFPQIIYRSVGLSAVGQDRWSVHGELTLRGISRQVDLDLAYLGTGPDPWGGTRASFKATAELKRDDFAMSYNQVVTAGIAAIGTTLRVELDIQAVQGQALPTM